MMSSKLAHSLFGIIAGASAAAAPVSVSATELTEIRPIAQPVPAATEDGAELAFQRRGGGASRPQARPAGNRAAAPQTRPGARGGGQQHQVRSSASANINHNANANRNVNRNVNRDVNRDVNRNINYNHNVDVDVHHDYGYRDWDDDWDNDHPFATAAAVTAGVALTAAAIGSIVRTIPPSCANVIVNGITYYQCGSSWYQPQYAGTTVQYVVVNPPR